MSRRVRHPPPAIPAAVRSVHDRLVAAGEEALLAGGAVRDHLLGRPAHDFDIATSAPPERVAALFPRTVLVGAQFGVVRVIVGEPPPPGGGSEGTEASETRTEVEVATFRADLAYRDGRHPEGVRFTDAREDALRRDFTVNGLFYDPDRGEVIDHVGGLEDLAAGVIRAIGDPALRFAEDRLRLLRAVRFSTTLGFPIEPATWSALVENAAAILEVSGERIRDELAKMLVHARRELAYHLLSDSGLMAAILPEVEAMRGVEQPPEYHPEGDVHRHTGLVLSHLREPSFGLALGALLHDIGKPPSFEVTDRIRFHGHDAVGAGMAEAICERLRLSRREREQVVYLVRRHLAFIAIDEMRPSRRSRLFDEEHFPDLLELCRADCLGSHGDLTLPTRAEELYRAYLAAGPPVEPILRGRDLIAIGYDPGPRLGTILRAVEDARRDGEVADPGAALAWVRERYPAGGSQGRTSDGGGGTC